MSRRHYEITLDEAIPGMILSDDLLDAQGKILLPKGATLSEASIASLRRRVVYSLPIMGEEMPDNDDSVKLGQQQRLALLFRKHTADDAATETLRQFIVRFRLGVHS